MLRRLTSKRMIAAVSVLGVLALAGGAFAYFTSSGSGAGQATVGSAGSWTVAFGATSGTMYPGAGTSTVNYTVTNGGSGKQQLTGTTAAVATDGSNIKSNGTAVSGCLAAWFSVTNHSPAAADLAPNASATGSADVTMSDSGTSQDACQNKTPDILVSAN